MAVLLLRIAAPLQSWGCGSRYETRQTNGEVTKSGVIGLLANSLGRQREDDISDLVSLKFGVRVDQPGTLLRDFQTVSAKGKSITIMNRYYLQDAVFLIGLESDDESMLQNLADAILHPKRILYFGRRACPMNPTVLGVRQGSLLDVLSTEKWVASDWYQKKQERMHQNTDVMLYVDSEATSETYIQSDTPLTFDFYHRGWVSRNVLMTRLRLSENQSFVMCDTILDMKDLEEKDFFF